MVYTVEAKVGGKLAQLGGRLIDGFARKLTDEFFNRFQLAVEGPAEEPASDPEAELEHNDETKKGWLKRLIS